MTTAATDKSKGEVRHFPRHRRTVLDILRASRSVPAFPLHRTMQMRELESLRRGAPSRIGWTSLFARAYGVVSSQIHELREVFVSHPMGYLYRHPNAVGSVAIHRTDEQGQQRLIFGRIASPERRTLSDIQSELEHCTHGPIGEVYREGLAMENRPWPIRMAAWQLIMHWSGRKRAKHVGTFSISSLGGFGALNGYHPLITTTSLAFGPLNGQGEMDVVLLCDHRAIDGMLGAHALALLEQTLREQMADEIRHVGQDPLPSQLAVA